MLTSENLCRRPHKLVRDAVGLDLEAICAIMCLWSPICALCCELDSRGPFLFEVSPCQPVVRCVLGNAPPPATAATTCLCQIRFLGLGRVGRRKQGCGSVNSSERRLNMRLAFHQPSSLMLAFSVQSLREGKEGTAPVHIKRAPYLKLVVDISFWKTVKER